MDLDENLFETTDTYARYLSRELELPYGWVREILRNRQDYNFHMVDSRAQGLLETKGFKDPVVYRDAPLNPHARGLVNRSSREGVVVFAITSRPATEEIVKMTYWQIKKSRLLVDALVFAGQKKVEVILAVARLGVTAVAIDDHLVVIRGLQRAKKRSPLKYKHLHPYLLAKGYNRRGSEGLQVLSSLEKAFKKVHALFEGQRRRSS